MNPIRILHVVLSLFSGGMENGIINLINNSGKDFEHVVCCLRDRGFFANRLNPQVKIIEMLIGPGNNYFMPFKLSSVILKERIQLIRTYNEDPLFYSFFPSLLLNKPLIHYNGGRTLPEIRRRILLEKFFANKIPALVVPSQDLKDYLHTQIGIKKDKITVIPNGVDSNKFKRSIIDIKKKKESLGLPVDDLIIGTVGRLVDQKDYPTFLDAAQKIISRKKNTSFIIIGDGQLRQKLEAITNNYGISKKVKFLGNRNDIHELYHIMDIFMLTARWEGMSNVVLEAMASGKPILTTQVEGMSGLIINGFNGFLFKPGDVEGFSHTALNLTNHEIMNLGKNAQNTVKENFSLEKMNNEYEQLYLRLVMTNQSRHHRI